MTTCSNANATLTVRTFKDGVLSAVAHDLRINVASFSIDVDEERFCADIDANSLKVITAMRDEEDDPRALSPRDKRTIEDAIKNDVLRSGAHPNITVIGPWINDGTTAAQVTIRGVTKSIPLSFTQRGDEIVATTSIHQPDFGIKPYTALLGALRVRADVVVTFVVNKRHLSI